MERAWSSRLHKVPAFGLWFLSLFTIAAHSTELAKSDRLAHGEGRENRVTMAAGRQALAGERVDETGTLTVLLQLEAFINGVSTGLVGSFRLDSDGSLWVAPDELREIGLMPDPAALTPEGVINLRRLPNVAYEYDESAQAIRFTTGDGQRIPRRLDIGGSREDGLGEIERGFGALVNYTLTANFDTDDYRNWPDYSGIYGYFDARLFTGYGTLDSGFAVRSSSWDGDYATRLDTAWRYSDPHSLTTYIAGDVISSGLAWTRPIRMGGMQIRRNFSLRPDLVTIPIPELTGSAAVPSALEVYMNGIRTYANDIPSGPFVIDNLPAITGAGVARIIVRDTTTGQATEAQVDFYASSLLLRPGLADYAVEAGLARRDYGIESDSYDDDVIGSASVRYGLTEHMTLEAHGEAGAGVVNGGGGVAVGLGSWGVGSLAGAASAFDGEEGFLLAASLEAAFGDWRLFMRSQRTFGEYHDLASVTVDRTNTDRLFFSARPPIALDQVSLAIPLYFDDSSINLSFTHIEDRDDESHVVSISYDRPLFSETTLFATAYVDVGERDEAGLYAGVVMQFGGGITGASGVEYNDGRANAFVDMVKPDQDEEGSFGWRLRAGLGEQINSLASGAYVGRYARVEAGGQQYGGAANLAVQMRGAIVTAGGDVFLSRQIDDSFAIVDVGAPDVEVTAGNRPVGRSGLSGKVIVPRLNSYERNRIAIDPTNLPVDADIPETSRIVVPAERTGVVIAFDTNADSRSALVQFVDVDHRPLEAGLAGRLGEKEFIVGYNGEAYLTDLAARNAVIIDLPDGAKCQAQFNFRKIADEQQLISEVPCR